MGRRGFAFAKAPPAKVPKADKLVVGVVGRLPPPEAVKEQLVSDNPLIMAIDVETHALVRQSVKEWRLGRFGFRTKLSDEDADFLRIIQVG